MSISYLLQDFEVRSFIAMHDWRSRVSFLARPVGFYTCSCIQHFAAATQPVLAILHNFAPFCRISCNRLLVSWHTCNQRMQARGLTAKLELIISRKFGANWILQLRGNKQNKHNVIGTSYMLPVCTHTCAIFALHSQIQLYGCTTIEGRLAQYCIALPVTRHWALCRKKKCLKV